MIERNGRVIRLDRVVKANLGWHFLFLWSAAVSPLCGRRAGCPTPIVLPTSITALVVARVEDQTPAEEWQNLRGHATLLAPGLLSPHPVVFFRFVSYPELIQFVGKGLIGIHMIVIRIATRPVKLEPSQGFEVFRVLWSHCFQKEVVAQAFGELGINDEIIPILMCRQINEKRRFFRIRQMGLKNRGEDC